MKLTPYVYVTSVLVASLSLPANAASIRVTDLVTGFNATLNDNAVGDANPNDGVMVWSFSPDAAFSGSVWNSVISVGFTKPALGIPGVLAAINLDVSAESSGAGRLLVEFSETGFLLPTTKNYAAALSFDASGDGGETTLLNGSTSTAYFDADNTLFGKATTIATPFGFSCSCEVPDSDGTIDTDVLPPDADGLFALTHAILFEHQEAGLGQAAIQLEMNAVPLPGGVLLMGSALAGFFASTKRRMSLR